MVVDERFPGELETLPADNVRLRRLLELSEGQARSAHPDQAVLSGAMVDVLEHRGLQAVSDRRSDLAVVSFLVDVVKEPADRGHHRRGAHTVGQVETVSHARQFDVAHGGLGNRPHSVDERARLPDGDEPVVAPVYRQERWCERMNAFRGRCRTKDLGMTSL